MPILPLVAGTTHDMVLGLHMHDRRREAGSRLLERGDFHTVHLLLHHANISASSRKRQGGSGTARS
jgi:hypothetical protein